VIERVTVIITFMLVSALPDYCFIRKLDQKVFFSFTLYSTRYLAGYLQLRCRIFGIIRSMLSHNVLN
jgi:hypothetical protein